MKIYILFLTGCFVAGGMKRAEWFRRRPLLLLAVSTVVAASFYSLSVIE